MSLDDLSAYFKTVQLPEELRLDMACKQINVAENVELLLANLQRDPTNWRYQHRLLKIKNAIENPYSGRDIPRY